MLHKITLIKFILLEVINNFAFSDTSNFLSFSVIWRFEKNIFHRSYVFPEPKFSYFHEKCRH